MAGFPSKRVRRRNRLGRIVLAVALALPLAALTSALAPARTAEAAPREIVLSAPGPLGGITVIGDSVMLGSGLFSPTLPDQLQAMGWGPVRYRAGEGYSTGAFNVPTSFRASSWISLWRSQGWDPGAVIVNLGANDSGFCGTDLACARTAIAHLADVIGPTREIWWPQITRLFTDADDVWNLALRQLAAERPNFHTWDWPTAMWVGGYASHDGIHLAPDGYRRRSAQMAYEATLALAHAERTGPDAAVPAAGAAPSTYVPLTPERIVDTREDPPGRRPAGSTFAVDFGDRLPDGATAVAINVTAAGPAGQGYLAAAPCGTAPGGSTVNFTPDRSRGAMTVTPLGTDGDVCIYAHTATDVVVDLQGAFVGDATGAGFAPLASPQRVLDSRQTGRTAVHTIAAPAGADAVAVNLTAVNAALNGFVRAFPCDATTDVSNVNFGPGEAVAGSAFVPVSAAGTICVTSNRDVDVVVDLTGTFASGTGLRFVPASPTRMLDTRNGTGGWAPIHGADQSLDITVAPPEAAAVTGTLTMIRPLARGFLRAAACGSGDGTSSVNAPAGIVLANSVTTGVAAGRLCVTSSRATQTAFDTTGWWVP